MIDINPYENKTDLDIPKMASVEEKIEPATEEVTEEEVRVIPDRPEPERKPAKKRNSLWLFVMIIVLLVILCGVFAFLYFRTKASLLKLEDSHAAYKTEMERRENAYLKEIEDLKATPVIVEVPVDETPEQKPEEKPVDTVPEDPAVKEYVTRLAINIRSGPSTMFETVAYDDLPDDIKKIALPDRTIKEGVKVKILETKEAGDDLWGRIAEDAWIVLRYGGYDYVE